MGGSHTVQVSKAKVGACAGVAMVANVTLTNGVADDVIVVVAVVGGEDVATVADAPGMAYRRSLLLVVGGVCRSAAVGGCDVCCRGCRLVLVLVMSGVRLCMSRCCGWCCMCWY